MSGGQEPAIIRNAAHCHVCDTVIESRHRYDFQVCDCLPESKTSISIDGGLIFLKRCFLPDSQFTDLSETEGGPERSVDAPPASETPDEAERIKGENEGLRWSLSIERGMAQRFADALLSGPFRGGRMRRRERMYGSEWAEVHQVLDDWESHHV